MLRDICLPKNGKSFYFESINSGSLQEKQNGSPLRAPTFADEIFPLGTAVLISNCKKCQN